MSTPNDTLRAHLEAIRDLVTALDDQTGVERECLRRAEAALDLLNHAPAGTAARFIAHRVAREDHNYALVPDPGGRAAPPPTTTTTP